MHFVLFLVLFEFPNKKQKDLLNYERRKEHLLFAQHSNNAENRENNIAVFLSSSIFL